MSITEVKVPDIGDFESVEIIEVICKKGDTVCSFTDCGSNSRNKSKGWGKGFCRKPDFEDGNY